MLKSYFQKIRIPFSWKLLPRTGDAVTENNFSFQSKITKLVLFTVCTCLRAMRSIPSFLKSNHRVLRYCAKTNARVVLNQILFVRIRDVSENNILVYTVKYISKNFKFLF